MRIFRMVIFNTFRKMTKNNPIILHPLFIISLILLLINDLYFKAHFHNAITGKLSDITGLIVFSQFLISILGFKHQKYIYLSIALFFTFWKSSYSQGLIEIWSQTFYTIHRNIDPSDLLCLLVFVLLYKYPLINLSLKSDLQQLKIPLYFLALLAILATSRAKTLDTNRFYLYETFRVDSKIPEFINKLNEDNISYLMDSFFVYKRDTFQRIILKNFKFGKDRINRMEIGLKEKKKNSLLFLYFIDGKFKQVNINNSYLKNARELKKKYKISFDTYLSK
jgi:hypothetical protein